MGTRTSCIRTAILWTDRTVEILPNNFYGLAWLENDGTGVFTSHELTRYWGAYAVKAADLDGDGDLDLALSGVQLPNMYPQDEVQNLIWLENDGSQNFARRIPSVASRRS